MTADCISIILPVYNEEGNIAACLRGLTAALQGLEHEILVCYDFDGDSTLPAIERMPDRPATVKPVLNTLGRGAAAAIRAGFAAARGDVLVTTMADLSDPPEVIRAMARKIREEGADVVSGSRYMKGGSQTGGPGFKVLLSRAAGLSLRWIAGLGTHDATTNFRAYSAKYIRQVEIESRNGMELALELTVKAHLRGFRVDEVPSSWRDRSAGESRFQLWKWLPRYLRWYLQALADPLLVWTVLVGASIAALVFAVRHAPLIPFIDEWYYIPLLSGREPLSLDWLWAQHNEHRIPLSKLLWFGVMRISGLDARWGAVLNVLLLTAASAVLVRALMRFRGQASWTDAFVPLLFLHWDHGENMAWPFQIPFTLHLLLLSLLLALILALRRTPSRTLSLPFGLCLLALPLVGPSTLPFVVFLSLWWISISLRERSRGNLLLSVGLPVAALFLAGLTRVGYQPPAEHPPTPGLAASLNVAWQFLAGSLGHEGNRHWPASGWIALAALAFPVGMLLRPAAGRSGGGLLLMLAGLLGLAFLVGHSRAGFTPFAGFYERYVTLSCLAPLLVYVAAEFCGVPVQGRVVRTTLAATMALLFALNAAHEWDGQLQRRQASEALDRDLRTGLPIPMLARRHLAWYPDPRKLAAFERDLRQLHEAKVSAFRNIPLPDSAARWEGGTLTLNDGRLAGEAVPVRWKGGDPGIQDVRIDYGRLTPSTQTVQIRAIVGPASGEGETVWSGTLEGPMEVHKSGSFQARVPEGSRLWFQVDPAPAPELRTWFLLETRPSR